MEKGFIYISSGTNYILEALLSASTLRIHHTTDPIYLYTDSSSSIPDCIGKKADSMNIEVIKYHASSPYEDFSCILQQSPFAKTIFLESDTFFEAAVDDIFSICSSYDICFAPNIDSSSILYTQGIPACFKVPDTGILAFNKSNSSGQLLSYIRQIYLENVSCRFSLGELILLSLWKQPLFRHFTLPYEYCSRSRGMYQLGLSLNEANPLALRPLMHHMRVPGSFTTENLTSASPLDHLSACRSISAQLYFSDLLDSSSE